MKPSLLPTKWMTWEEMLPSWLLLQERRKRRRKLSTLPRPFMPFRSWRPLDASSDHLHPLSCRRRRQSMLSAASSTSCQNTSFYSSSSRIRWRTNDLSTALLPSRGIANALRWLARLPLRISSMERRSMPSLSSLATLASHWLPATLNASLNLESSRWIPSRARTRAIHLMRNIPLRSWSLPRPTLWPRYLFLISDWGGSRWEMPTKSSRSLHCNSRNRMMRWRRSLTSSACSRAMVLDTSNRVRGGRNLTCFI
mmetsp:Transcript_17788/g.38426  ORF Transcript_17788/g.38426 Transcript_17788/m.38426 type:complete len:254 (+) Transcript_17788:2100-2861(+)